MKQTFNLHCVSFDGSHVKNSEHETIQEAQNESANMGSRWYFYPFHVIVKGKTIADTGGSIYRGITTANPVCCLSEKYKGKRFETFLKDIKKLSQKEDMQNADADEFEQELINL